MKDIRSQCGQTFFTKYLKNMVRGIIQTVPNLMEFLPQPTFWFRTYDIRIKVLMQHWIGVGHIMKLIVFMGAGMEFF